MNNIVKVQRVAVIGAGSIGRRHISVLKQLRPDIQIIAVIREGSEQLDSPPNSDFIVNTVEQAISLSIQAAIIATPANSHIEIAVQLAKEGINLLIEKPLSTDLAPVRKLAELVSAHNLVCLVGYNLRQLESFSYFQSLVNQQFGEIQSVEIVAMSDVRLWRPGVDLLKIPSSNPKLGGGVLFELSHEIDYMRELFGCFEITSSSLTFDPDFLDAVETKVSVQAQNSLIGFEINLELDMNSVKSLRHCKVNTTTQVLEWNILESEVIVTKQYGEKQKVQFDEERNSSYQAQISHWLDCIEIGGIPLVSLDQGIQDLELILNIKNFGTGK